MSSRTRVFYTRPGQGAWWGQAAVRELERNLTLRAHGVDLVKLRQGRSLVEYCKALFKPLAAMERHEQAQSLAIFREKRGLSWKLSKYLNHVRQYEPKPLGQALPKIGIKTLQWKAAAEIPFFKAAKKAQLAKAMEALWPDPPAMPEHD